MIRHHASETTLAAYATGGLPQALALVTAAHLEVCSLCQRSVRTLEATGGAMLADMPPVPLAADALDRLLARVDEPPPLTPPMLNPALPPPLDRAAMGRWWPIGLGMWYRPLLTGGSAWGGLLLGQPGRSLPRHAHKGLELTYVLTGAFVDGTGQYSAGDLEEPVIDHDRPPVVIGTQPCLCVIASEGMRLRGALGLAQRLIGQ